MNWDKVSWEKIRIFYHVAKAGSFSLAAERLNITQPSLSRSIQILEHVTKTKLFHRHARGLKLTKEGELLFEHAINMNSYYEHAISNITDEKEEPKGKLRISTTTGLASIWFIDDFINFAKLYPDIKLSIFGSDSAENLSLESFDIAIRGEVPRNPDYVSEYLTTFHEGLFASREYLAEFGEPKKLVDLDNHRLISFGTALVHPFEVMKGGINWHLVLGVKEGQIRESVMEFNSTIGLIRAAEKGIGIIAVPVNHPALLNSNLVPILTTLSDPITIAKSYFIYPRQIRHVKRVTLFIDYIKESWLKDGQALKDSP